MVNGNDHKVPRFHAAFMHVWNLFAKLRLEAPDFRYAITLR
ncbi:hypothetical protein [Ensifer sp.]|nr:hypothetical protein [Ensifer sp.]